MTLCLSNESIDLEDIRADRFRNIEFIYDLPDVLQISVDMSVTVVMTVAVIMAVTVVMVVTVVMAVAVIMAVAVVMIVAVVMAVRLLAVTLVEDVISGLDVMLVMLMMLMDMTVYVQTLLFLSVYCHFQVCAADPASLH